MNFIKLVSLSLSAAKVPFSMSKVGASLKNYFINNSTPEKNSSVPNLSKVENSEQCCLSGLGIFKSLAAKVCLHELKYSRLLLSYRPAGCAES